MTFVIFFLNLRGVTLPKYNQSRLYANWNCNSLPKHNNPIFNAIAAIIAKTKGLGKCNFLIFL
jgi:hypothetical protein